MKTGCEYMKCTHLKDGICQYEGAICKYREHVDNTYREKAEKWDKFDIPDNDYKTIEQLSRLYGKSTLWKYLKGWAEHNLLMSNLWVREKCKGNNNYHTNAYDNVDCPYCHGTGTITRPATVEEVREGIDLAFRFRDTDWVHDTINHTWGYRLKSGATLFMKEKDESL